MQIKNRFRPFIFILCFLLISVGNAEDNSISLSSKLNKEQKQFLKTELREKGYKIIIGIIMCPSKLVSVLIV